MLAVMDIMTTSVQKVTPDTVLLEVLATMNNNNLRHVPVVENEKLVGIISDRDIRLAMNSTLIDGDLDTHFSWLERFVAKQCMTKNPMTIEPTASINRAAAIFHQNKFGALPVVDQGKLVGIITVTDLLAFLAEHEEMVSD